MTGLREEILELLQIIEIVFLCVISLMFYEFNDIQKKRTDALESKLQSMKTELQQMENELKHNNNIVDKLLNEEW